MKSLADFIEILKDVKYKNWVINVFRDGEEVVLQVWFLDGDETQHGRKWRLSLHMTKSELVQTALKAVLAAEEHETREKFLYRGAPVFGPHIDVDKLWELTTEGGGLDVRP